MRFVKHGALLVGFVGTLTVAVALAGWATMRRLASEERMGALAVSRSTLEAELRRASTRLTRAQEAMTALKRLPSVTSPAVAALKPRPAAASVAQNSRRRPSAGEEIERLLATARNNPAIQQAEDAEHLAQLRWYYRGFIQRLQLSDDQTAKFFDLVAKREAQFQDLLGAARSLGVSVFDETVVALSQKDTDACRAAQRRLLGDAGAKELERYDDTMDARHLAMGFAGMATLANEPLAPAQVERLVDIISAASRPPAYGPFPRRVDVDWTRVDAEVKGLLTPTQVALFQSAESPGIGRGGSRFILQVNYAIMTANRAELMGRPAAVTPQSNPSH